MQRRVACAGAMKREGDAQQQGADESKRVRWSSALAAVKTKATAEKPPGLQRCQSLTVKIEHEVQVRERPTKPAS